MREAHHGLVGNVIAREGQWAVRFAHRAVLLVVGLAWEALTLARGEEGVCFSKEVVHGSGALANTRCSRPPNRALNSQLVSLLWVILYREACCKPGGG